MIALKTLIKLEEKGYQLIEIDKKEEELYLCIDSIQNKRKIRFGMRFHFVSGSMKYKVYGDEDETKEAETKIISIIKSEREHRLHSVCKADYIEKIG